MCGRLRRSRGAATGPCLDPWRGVHERDRRRTLVRRRGVRAGRMRAGHLQLSPGRARLPRRAGARPGRREPRAARPDRRAHLGGEEIAAFGGDPGNVTAFGESAERSSIVALLTSPLAEGQFDRAWAMSPSLSQLRTLERARGAADELARAAGSRSTTPTHGGHCPSMRFWRRKPPKSSAARTRSRRSRRRQTTSSCPRPG